MVSLKIKFGKRVKELRKALGKTQEQIAEQINIEPPNFSKMECGMHFPQPEKIEKIAEALGVSVQELFDFGHIKSREELLDFINSTIKELDDKKLELIYKFVYNLKLYK